MLNHFNNQTDIVCRVEVTTILFTTTIRTYQEAFSISNGFMHLSLFLRFAIIKHAKNMIGYIIIHF